MENSDCNESAGDIMTMEDAVKELQNDEDEAIAIYGAGEENLCTYSDGYIDRQAVFVCKTCNPLLTSHCGVCYGCSIHCHKDHELMTLYTKRNFRCDCGNSKFESFKCKLQEDKDPINVENSYNHNFIGLYCTCDRPYPDPDDEVEDEMIQCMACEDWFHSRHLGSRPPPTYSEMVCDVCMNKHKFLTSYIQHSEPEVTMVTNGETSADVDVTSSTTESTTSLKRKHESCDEQKGCKLKTSTTDVDVDLKAKAKATYWKEGWRNELCVCEECVKLYKDTKIDFITKAADTISAYENKGKANAEKVMENAANSISQMNHVQQMELIRGYNDLKTNLHEFLNDLKDKQQVVTKEDIEKFFEGMNERKKRQRMDGQPPETCR